MADINDISRFTGLSKPEVDEIWKKVKQNSIYLNSCVYHDFSIDATPDKQFGKRFKCTNCGGEVSENDKRWYEKGRLHEKENKR